MKIEMPRLKIDPPRRRRDREALEQSVVVSKDAQRSGILRTIPRRAVASRDKDDRFPRRLDAHLVCVYSEIERAMLIDLLADRSIRQDRVHGQRARVVVNDQQMRAQTVDRSVDRPCRSEEHTS